MANINQGLIKNKNWFRGFIFLASLLFVSKYLMMAYVLLDYNVADFSMNEQLLILLVKRDIFYRNLWDVSF